MMEHERNERCRELRDRLGMEGTYEEICWNPDSGQILVIEALLNRIELLETRLAAIGEGCTKVEPIG